jgi:integrase
MKKPAPKPKPVHVARCNAVRVTVYRNGPARYGITWRKLEHGPRIRETFGTRAAAVARADAIALALHNGRADVLTLTHADRENYQRAIEALAPLGIPLHAAIAEYTAARAILGTHSIHEAAQFFASRRIVQAAAPPTAEIVASILGDLRADVIQPVSGTYLSVITPRLRAIAAAFPDLADATPETVARFLRTLQHRGRPVSPKTFNHYRATFALLWRWCELRGLVSGKTPLAGVKRLDAPGTREVFTVGELRALLAYVPREWIPLVTLGAFAGLRVCEIARLSWDALCWDAGEIRIRAGVAGKRGSPRNVPMLEPLRAWLAPWRNALGRIYPGTERALGRRLEWFHKQAAAHIPGFRWKENALRHSFGSYHAAKFQNLELTRAIMGTSITMLRRHYHDPQFQGDAEQFWNILPTADSAGKILAIA